MSTSPTGKSARISRPNLRDVQKALTRSLIRDAARDLFDKHGYHGATIDQIVATAGASRQTFYLHFTDKEDVLNEIIADYLPRAMAEMEKLQGPAPSMTEILAWMTGWVQFVMKERASITVISEYGVIAGVRPPVLRLAISWLIGAFAKRIPAFDTALHEDEVGFEARARSELLISGVTWAARAAIQNEGTPYAPALVKVISEMIHDFVHDPRFTNRASGSAP